MRSRRTGPIAAATALLLLAGGCGDSDGGSPAAKQRPERIVSLSPSATETLFAVGAGDQVVATDDQSDYPPAAPTTELSAYEPNLEAIAAHEPDLVIAPADAPRDLIGGLRKLGLAVHAQPAPEELREAYAQVRNLGVATGHPDEGRRVAREMRARIDELIESAPDAASLSVFHELDPDLYSAASESFIGRIYARLGLRNIADRAAGRTGSPYPQLSTEAVLGADPDLVVLADSKCCGQTPAKVRRRPGWASISAVREGAVVAIDDDIASRWGPRLPSFVERVVAATERARAGG
jgi:iron complex transport system substrate-binding protein